MVGRLRLFPVLAVAALTTGAALLGNAQSAPGHKVPVAAELRSAAASAQPPSSPTSTVPPSTTPPSTVPPSTTPPSTVPESGPGTNVRTYDPFDADGQLEATLDVTEQSSAQCFGGGVAGSASYRCFAQPSGDVYDPCFAPPQQVGGPYVCPANPAGHDVVVLTPVSVSVAVTSVPPTSPWAFALTGGQICTLVDAAWGTLGPFPCSNPVGGGAVASPMADCHEPSPGSPWWSADCQATLDTSSPFLPVDVATVWS